MQAVIEAHGLGKQYRLRQTPGQPEFWALRDLDLTIQAGEIFGIVGVNGSGKSTLMKLISKVIRPTEGYTVTRGRVGALLEVSAGFHPELTGRENAYLKGTAMGMSRDEVRDKLDAIVEFADLAQFVDTPIKHYSSGMTMRLGFAIAAKVRPEIFLVDEAFAVGDGAFQEKCLAELEAIVKEGSTVLVVSHIMSHITRLCERALWLHQGRSTMLDEVKTVTNAYMARTFSPTADTQTDTQVGYFQSPPDSKWPFSITEMTLLNHLGHASDQLEMRQPFRIRLSYEVHREEIGHISIQLTSREESGWVIYIGDADIDERLRGPRHVGRYTAEVEIPAWLLNEGNYVIHTRTEIPNVMSYQAYSDMINFRIVDGGSSRREWYKKRRHGVIGMDLPWTYIGDEPV